MPRLPGLIGDFLAQHDTAGTQAGPQRTREIETLRRQLRASHRRLYFSIAGAALLVSSAVAFGTSAAAGVGDVPLYGWITALAGAILLLRAWPGQKP